jgi:xylan 1,4-beta-xylosidase
MGRVCRTQRPAAQEEVIVNMIQNPVLPGFNPDPSICRVGDDYYIATSTFEWYPGVQIHHSRDLVNWTLVRRPLERESQLNMLGNPDSCGVWAPCLSYADGQFWLVYTDVKRFGGSFKDALNYIVTSPTIEGEWSDPVFVNASGFDPSLFHDDDGRKWIVNQLWNHRPEARNTIGHKAFDGIVLQEYDPVARKLTGPVHNIFGGTTLGLVEGPHLFKRDGWYYLTTAEGGTGYDHAVTMARSRNITGPYECHPDLHVITSRNAPEAPVQRAGHGQYVETPDGQFYHTHLMGRPLAPHRRCTLGRETGLQKVVWRDGWLYLEHGGQVPTMKVASPTQALKLPEVMEIVHEFDDPVLPMEFQWLRTPKKERIFSLTERPGFLRIFGRQSLGSWFEQGLVGRRQEHVFFRAETAIDCDFENYQQVAGLSHYYNRYKFHALGLTTDEKLGTSLIILSSAGSYPEGELSYPIGMGQSVPDGKLHLALEVRGNDLQFFWKKDADEWQAIGPVLDASVISDEGGDLNEHGSFTGAFAAMFALDVSGQGKPADFDRFVYKALET